MTPNPTATPNLDLLRLEILRAYEEAVARNPLPPHAERERILTAEDVDRLAARLRGAAALRRNRRAAISGCVGSGKTLLAVEKARRLGREGFRTLLVCLSEPPAAHLRECVRRLGPGPVQSGGGCHGRCCRSRS